MKKLVAVTQYVSVEIDETKFDNRFLEEFRESFYEFDLDDHFKHLAQLEASGLTGCGIDNFIEGYGPAKDMGIDMSVEDIEVELVE